jgi:hypothetical protein
MSDVTIGQLLDWLEFVLKVAAALGAVIVGVKKAIKPLLAPIEKKIDSVDMEHTKNYLVRFLAEVERSQEHDEIEIERFHEQYEHYIKIGGNSYIKAKVEKLKGAGML